MTLHSSMSRSSTSGAASPPRNAGRIKRGWLQAIKVGRPTEDRVAVAFIEDDKLGSHALLGMSFLNRFRLTIDDRNDRTLLMRK